MGKERRVYMVLVGKPEGKRPLGRPRRRWKMESEWILRRLAGGCGLDSTGSGQGPVAGCCECGDEPSGSCATELVSYLVSYATVHVNRSVASKLITETKLVVQRQAGIIQCTFVHLGLIVKVDLSIFMNVTYMLIQLIQVESCKCKQMVSALYFQYKASSIYKLVATLNNCFGLSPYALVHFLFTA
jgi:hypothetical protein